jgi:hypothetical protein
LTHNSIIIPLSEHYASLSLLPGGRKLLNNFSLKFHFRSLLTPFALGPGPLVPDQSWNKNFRPGLKIDGLRRRPEIRKIRRPRPGGPGQGRRAAGKPAGTRPETA